MFTRLTAQPRPPEAAASAALLASRRGSCPSMSSVSEGVVTESEPPVASASGRGSCGMPSLDAGCSTWSTMADAAEASEARVARSKMAQSGPSGVDTRPIHESWSSTLPHLPSESLPGTTVEDLRFNRGQDGYDAACSYDSPPSLAQRGCRGRLRHRIWQFLTCDSSAHPILKGCAMMYQGFTTMLICLLFVVDSRTMSTVTTYSYLVMEICAMIVFSFEYVLRLYSCLEIDRGHHPRACQRILTRMHFAVSPMMLLDFLCLLSIIIDLQFPSDKWRGFMSTRLLRLLNIFRVERNFRIFRPVLHVIWIKRRDLMSTVAISMVLLLVSSATMYYIESPTNPAFPSIIESMWWATTALTTVGYGDKVPRTALGRVVGSVVAFVGVGLFALPAGIIASGFEEELMDRKGSIIASRSLVTSHIGNIDIDTSRTFGRQVSADKGRTVADLDKRLDAMCTEFNKGLEGLHDEVRAIRAEQRQLAEGQQRILDSILSRQTAS